MTTIKLPILSDLIARYSYGYSTVDDIESVTNWQDGNNTFQDIPDGTYYFFGALKDGNTDLYFRKKIRITSENCSIEVSGFTLVASQCSISFAGFIEMLDAPVYSFDLITGYYYTPPVSEVSCEILANPHTQIPEAKDRGQHSYALVNENVVCADLFSQQGQLNHDGTWVSLITLGQDSLGRRLAGAKTTYSGTPSVMKFRTRSGCPDYSDSRPTEFENYDYSWKKNITASASSSPANLNVDVFQFASGRPQPQAQNGKADIWVLWFPGHNQNIQARFENGAWLGGYNDFADASKGQLPVTAIGVNLSLEKDFVMDLSDDGGATYDTFICRRWSTGGHYATVITCRRLGDNETIVSTTIGKSNVPSRLKIGGTPYDGGGFGCCFNLGPQTSDLTAIFNFTQSDTDWATIQLLI